MGTSPVRLRLCRTLWAIGTLGTLVAAGCSDDGDRAVRTTATPETAATPDAVASPPSTSLSVTSLSVTSSPDTRPSDAGPATTIVGPASSELTPERAGELAESIAARLLLADSYRATARVRRTVDDVTVEFVGDITEFGDGRVWIEGTTNGAAMWASFEPTTGMGSVFIDAPQNPTYARVDGIADPVDMVRLVIGFDPIPTRQTVMQMGGDDFITEDDATWTIDASGFGSNPMDDVLELERWVIDRVSGLTIAYTKGTTDDEDSDEIDASFSDIVLGAELPAAFPGAFPDGAEVEEMHNPAQARFVTLDEALAEFGQSAVVPADLPPSATIAVRRTPVTHVAGDDELTRPPAIAVVMHWSSGLVRHELMQSKSLPTDEPLDDVWIEVGDGVCASRDGATCFSDATLEDAKATLTPDGPQVFGFGLVAIIVDSVSPAMAAQIAQSVVQVS